MWRPHLLPCEPRPKPSIWGWLRWRRQLTEEVTSDKGFGTEQNVCDLPTWQNCTETNMYFKAKHLFRLRKPNKNQYASRMPFRARYERHQIHAFLSKNQTLVTNDIMKRILCDFAYCFCVEKLQLAQNRPCFQLHSHASVSLLASFNLVQVNLPSAQRLNGLKPNRCLEIKLRSWWCMNVEELTGIYKT